MGGYDRRRGPRSLRAHVAPGGGHGGAASARAGRCPGARPARLLAKDPERRISAAEAEGALSRIVTPQSLAYERTRTEPGSPSPREASTPPAPTTGTQGFGLTPGPVPSPAPGRDGVAPRPEGFAPGPDLVAPLVASSGARRRPRRRALRAAPAGGLGLILALGGVWYALADRTTDGDGTAAPYGEAVGLGKPPREGDWVLADRPGGVRFSGTPRLTPDPTCREKAPDGQMMALVEAASADEARERGAAGCEERTRELRDKLADVRGYAAVPTDSGFDAAGRRTACLLLGGHGPAYGPLGERRRFGTALSDIATMQRRDCLDIRSNRDARLVPCGGPHDEVVLGFTRLAAASRSPRRGPRRTRRARRRCRRATMDSTRPSTKLVRGPARGPGNPARMSWSAPSGSRTGAPWRGPNHEEGVAMPGSPGSMHGSTKTMGVLTVGGLVVVTAYTVALGSNGWLWFGWVVLGLITLGMIVTRST